MQEFVSVRESESENRESGKAVFEEEQYLKGKKKKAGSIQNNRNGASTLNAQDDPPQVARKTNNSQRTYLYRFYVAFTINVLAALLSCVPKSKK